MYQPGLAETKAYIGKYSIVPIMKEIIADTETPIKLFQRFYQRKNVFLLESVEGGAKWARYSFIGFDPFLIVRGKGESILIQSRNDEGEMEEKHVTGQPIETLKALMANYRSPSLEGLPRFSGGAVGFFSYDLVQMTENIPPHQRDDLQMDHIYFLFCDRVIAFDHLKQRVKVIANMRLPYRMAQPSDDTALEKAYKKACSEIEAMVAELQQAVDVPVLHPPSEDIDIEITELRSNMSREQYEENVRKAQEYIRAGDIFQAVLSQRLEMDTDIDPFAVYRVLRTMNPSPYMYLLKMEDTTLVGTSLSCLYVSKEIQWKRCRLRGLDRVGGQQKKINVWNRSCWRMKRNWPNILCSLTWAETISGESPNTVAFR